MDWQEVENQTGFSPLDSVDLDLGDWEVPGLEDLVVFCPWGLEELSQLDLVASRKLQRQS